MHQYTVVSTPNPHRARRLSISAAHPEVRGLMGTNRYSAFWIVGLVGLQLAIAAGLSDLSWLVVFAAAYLIGAFVNHALYVLIHECTHNLVTGRAGLDRILAIVCDLALAVPGAMMFRHYHILHHRHLGELGRDPDVVSSAEARLVGNSPWRKVLWIALLSVSQALRPLIVQRRQIDVWFIANVLAVLATGALLFWFFGIKAVVYLCASTFFCLGLHPLGGRWIQEHYVTHAGQETYSYYGPLNRLCFNMGYHNEHHDYPGVPWNRLPKLTELAPEFYRDRPAYTSWTRVLVNFILGADMTPFSRIVRNGDCRRTRRGKRRADRMEPS